MKRLIFDFDGTLVDSMPDWGGKMLHVLEKYRADYPADIIKTLTPLGDIGSAKYFQEHFGMKRSVEELIADMDEYAYPKYAYAITAKAGVLESLTAWKKKGYSLSVLTASPHRMLDVCLRRNGLYELFDFVWSCEDFQTTKSDIRIYERVAEKLTTTTENCVFFDDNIHALTVAKKAGMQTVGGHDVSAADAEQEVRALCDDYVYDFRELSDKDI